MIDLLSIAHLQRDRTIAAGTSLAVCTDRDLWCSRYAEALACRIPVEGHGVRSLREGEAVSFFAGEVADQGHTVLRIAFHRHFDRRIL